MCLKSDANTQPPQQTELEDGEQSNDAGTGGLKAMTPEVPPLHPPLSLPPEDDEDAFVFIVRDLSCIMGGAIQNLNHSFLLPPTATVSHILVELARLLNTKSLSSYTIFYQSAEQVEIRDLERDKCLFELNFKQGKYERNNLVVLGITDYQTRKTDEDDLSLGASASPTSSTDKMWFDVPSTSDSASENPPLYGAASSNRIKQDTACSYVGLVNQAMTCYLNSLLQTLFMTPEFRNALYRWEFKGTEEEAAKSIPFQLQRLFLHLQTATKTAVETTNLTTSFGWDSSEVWQQHDIQELYRVMFDALEQCFKNTDQAHLINDLYEGKMKDYVKCLECSTENAREDSFLDIPLPIRPFGTSTAYKSVEDALRAFVEPELLTGNNKYECSKCEALCDAHKGLKFIRFPYLLTIHLKRFDFDYQTFHRIKLNDKVTFPNMLDLNGFIEDTKEDASCSSLDKCSTDKLDDASTTDSGSALEEENSSSEYNSSSNQTLIDADTQDEDEGIDVSSLYNEKNKQCLTNGPYVYELFSIMVHSGSASGGHYYAYIKDFHTSEWFCFNDQTVSKITYDDIRKTYGGSNSRGGYYSSWSSSANAYMLMYRQADKNRNALVFTEQQFPSHIKNLVEKMISEEAAEKEAKEMERLTCKVKLFWHHPQSGRLLEKKFKIHKDTSFKDSTKLAYQELELENFVPLERCRLVKYDEIHDSIECSFENSEDDPISMVLGGHRATYKFDLFVEIRDEDKQFEEYKTGGVTVKVYTVDLSTEEVEGPQIIRASQNETVRQFKELLATKLSLDPLKLRVVQERYNDIKALVSDSKLLRDEGFYRSSKVYVEASGEEAPNFFCGSQMYYILDRYEHTINLQCKLPECDKEILESLQIPPYVEPDLLDSQNKLTAENSRCSATSECLEVNELTSDMTCLSTATSVTPAFNGSSSPLVANASVSSQVTCQDNQKKSRPSTKPSCQSLNGLSFSSLSSSSQTNVTPTSSLNDFVTTNVKGSSIAASNLSDGEDEGIVDIDGAVGGISIVNSDQSASEDSSLTSDSDRTLVGDQPEEKLSEGSHSPDYHDASSPEDNNKKDAGLLGDWDDNPAGESPWEYDDEKEEVKRYFRAQLIDDNVLRISVDKRITIGQLKKELQKHVGVAEEHFKLYKYYSNSSQEFECTRMTETLNSYEDNTVMKVTLGRALLPGEYKGKVFLLDETNSEEPGKFLNDFIICKGDAVSKVKSAIVAEVNSGCKTTELLSHRVRLRKKSWKNPQTVYLNDQIFGDDITLFPNWELYVQNLNGVEEKTDSLQQLCVFCKRWRPSTYTTDSLVEVVINEPTVEALVHRLSELSDIGVENIELAKGKGTFPCDMSLLEIHTDLDWNPKSGNLSQKPLLIMDDGSVIYYRDKTEPLKELSESERSDLSSEENTRLGRESHYSILSSYSASSRSRERGLKIYLNQNQ